MNTFQLIVAIAFGMFFGRSLEYIFGSILEYSTRKRRQEEEAEHLENLKQEFKGLTESFLTDISKTSKGVKVNGKENTSKRKRV
jgi:hypothetical protein